MKNSTKIYIVCSLVIAYILYETLNKRDKYANCEKSTTGINDMPEKAADACRKISSRADEIEAHYKGASGVIDSLMGLFSPNNYKAGDNTSTDLGRNIINNNLSQCEVTKIDNACNNTAISSQINSIDNSKCEYCQKNGCDVIGNAQINTNDMSQKCYLNSSIAALTEKTTSVDAQALAKVLQKTEGILSGNNITQKENCNIIQQDLSSTKYLDNRNNCISSLSSTQLNELKNCGKTMNNIQKNESKMLAECIIGQKIETSDKLKSDTKVKIENYFEQLSKGVDTSALMSGSLISVISCVIVAGVAFYFYNQEI